MSIGHVMIMASAGSGKTYALTDRFVQLLAAGAAPERIVALTFTRKAAGEFFDEILKKLARAAAEKDFATRLARDIGHPDCGPADFLRLLRAVIEGMPRLRLGTLDSFFGRIARTFPLELGLTGDFEVLQEHAAKVERRRVLQKMFARSPGGLAAAQKEFIEAFKRATFGTEEKRLAARLDGFLDEHQEVFLAAPSPEIWGNPARVWPNGCEWLRPGGKRLGDAVLALRSLLARRGLAEKQAGRFEAFFAALAEWTPGGAMPKPLEYLLGNVLDVWDDIRRGSAALTVERKKVDLTPDECSELATIVRHVVGAELGRCLETTRGIHAVLRGYDTIYHDTVRRAGRLTFGDVQRLLLPEASGRILASGSGYDGDRLLIDYRLDGQFDHWLLDEFQDTSFGQWSVLRNLIDEVVQDPTGERSFFCVGDVKQAIYTWRGGDPELFREIFHHYNRATPGTIQERYLSKSFRSAPAIIGMVNDVFGAADKLAELYPGMATEHWNTEWRTHESAHPLLSGQSAWLHADDEVARFDLTVRLLHEIDPVERGLDCVVLTRTNSTATALADFLRREGGIPAMAESDLHVATDNPVGVALLALVQAAAHPGDTLAREHLAMTPLGDLLQREGISTPEELTGRVLGQIHDQGFERTMEYWLHRIESKLAPEDSFSRMRGRQFLSAAALFDATGSRVVAEFVAFMERHAAADTDVSGVVKVMTIHKSKGLGFDVVVLPDLEGKRIDQARDTLGIEHAADRSVAWVLDLPSKLFYARDPVLNARVRAAEAEACHEALSLLYVAMTRAKRGLYVITKSPGESESRNYPKILASTLGVETQSVRIGQTAFAGGWAMGDGDWHRHVAARSALAEGAEGRGPVREVVAGVRAPRRVARRPSEGKVGQVGAAQLFATNGSAAAEFGTAVHSLLSEVEWAETSDVQQWSVRGLTAPAVAEASACVRSPRLKRVWSRIEFGEVWRERAFEVVLDGTWVTGTFDRVVIERDASGRVMRVVVFDFKTDRVQGEIDLATGVRRHAAQMRLYRRVVARLAGVPESAASCELVFTHVQECVAVTGESD